MKTGFFGTMALVFFSANVFAQKGNIKGIILDKTEALPGVSVNVDKNGGSLTDLDGSFTLIDIDTGIHKVHISYIGYTDQDIEVNVLQGQTTDMGTIEMTAGEHVIDEVQIVGNFQQGGRAKAINMTKMSDKAVTVLSSEGISKSPVKSTAYVIRQAPGVVVKDNKVSLRGTPVDWTSSLLNGDYMPTADEKDASRVFNFEVFPSCLIDYITINRSVTPDLEGDNIGGVINFTTKEPVTERTLNLDVSTGYDALSNKPTYNGSFLWGDISKNKKLSYIINGSYAGENYGVDKPDIAYGTNYNHSLARLELNRERGFRQTMGLNTGLNYKPNENLTLGAKVIGGRMIEDQYNNRTSYNWSDGSGARIRLQNSRGIFDHMLYGGELNASWKISDRFKIEGKVASYYNRFQYGNTPQAQPGTPNGNYTVEFVSPLLQFTDMTQTDFFGNKYDPNNAKDPNPYYYKLLDVDNPYKNGGDHYNNIQPKYQALNGSDPLTAKDYYLSSVFADLNQTHERDPIVGKLDFSYTANNKLKLQAGFKARMKEGERYVSFFEYRLNPVTSPKIFLSDQETTAVDPKNNYLKEWGSPYAGTFQPGLTKRQMNTFISQHTADLVATPMDLNNNTYNQWLGSSYNYKENVAAGYVMAEWKAAPALSFTGGLRIESTHLTETSDSLITDDNAPFGVNAQSVTINKTYLAVLPSLNALYTPDENSNIRASISRSFHRPNFEQTKPGSALYDRDQFLYTYGNPSLKPTYSLNFDLAYQYFWGTKGMFSIGAYYKDVTDHIFRTNQIDDGQTVAGFTVKTYDNARNSFVAGIEALVDRKFDFLPGFWKGFGVSANITYSYSQMSVPGRSKKQALTDQTPVMYNIALAYEKGKVATRLALNYTGAFSTELNLFSDPNTHKVVHDNTDYDVFMDKQYSLDYQFAYNITKRISGYVIVNNILDAPYRTYIGVPDRPLITEYYRAKFYLGVKFQL
jgi:TonB-dependent receptor